MAMTDNWRQGANAAKWIPVITTAEILNVIPKGLSARQCYQESRFDPNARNPASGAIGLFQLLPQYFPGAGRDPAKDIGTASDYLRSLHKRFSDWQLALAAYDWGPGSVDKWQKSGGTFATMPKETQDYVSQIVADVPVEGVLCKIQIPQPPVDGSQPTSSSVAPSLAKPPPKSLWQSVTGIFRPSVQNFPQPLPPSAMPSPPISFPTNLSKENSMSTPNPILTAAAPTLITAIQLIQAALNTILTGDPMQIPLRAGPAVAILVSQLELLLPGLATSEAGAVNTEAQAKLAGLITKLQALNTAKAP
jgi:Transglycosylase SLT domain